MVISGTITIGTLVALAAYVGRVYGPLTSLTNARIDLMTALVSFERVFEVLDTPNPLEDSPGAIDLVAPEGRIELDDPAAHLPDHWRGLGGLLGDPGAQPEPTYGAPVLLGLTAALAPGSLARARRAVERQLRLASLLPRLRRHQRRRADRRHRRPRPHPAVARAAIGVVAQDPHLFHE